MDWVQVGTATALIGSGVLPGAVAVIGLRLLQHVRASQEELHDTAQELRGEADRLVSAARRTRDVFAGIEARLQDPARYAAAGSAAASGSSASAGSASEASAAALAELQGALAAARAERARIEGELGQLRGTLSRMSIEKEFIEDRFLLLSNGDDARTPQSESNPHGAPIDALVRARPGPGCGQA